jgi:hypothetical protein
MWYLQLELHWHLLVLLGLVSASPLPLLPNLLQQ